jgi:hypothetical protein
MTKKTQRRIRKDDRGLRRLLAESAAERQQLKQDRPSSDFKAAAERAKAYLDACRARGYREGSVSLEEARQRLGLKEAR